MQELYKIALDWLRKQASQVIILVAGIFALYFLGSNQLAKLEAQNERQAQKIDKQADKIELLGMEIRKCDSERSALQAEVSFMRFALENRFPNLSLSPRDERN